MYKALKLWLIINGSAGGQYRNNRPLTEDSSLLTHTRTAVFLAPEPYFDLLDARLKHHLRSEDPCGRKIRIDGHSKIACRERLAPLRSGS